MFYIKTIRILTKKGTVSNLSLNPGLNIIVGPSNTGKSLILDCIDYLFGGDAKRISKEALQIQKVFLDLDANGDSVTLSRELGSNDIYVSGNSDIKYDGIYSAKKGSPKKPAINEYWLRLMGIYEPVTIFSAANGKTQALTVRTFIHSFMIDETRMIGENSILKNSHGWSKNIPVPTISALLYFATGNNYIAETEDKKLQEEAVNARKFASKRMVDRSLAALRDKQFTSIDTDKETRSVPELEKEINTILNQISAAEKSLTDASDQSQELSRSIINIDDQLAESEMLRKRYDSLRSQYESDIKRLTFIAEGDVHKDVVEGLDRCPFCNGELPKDKTQSCVDAAIEEVKKIEMKINDLRSAAEDLAREILLLSEKRTEVLSEREKLQEVIRGEIKPQIDNLREKLVEYTSALDHAKEKYMVQSMVEILEKELVRVNQEDDNELASKFNVKAKILEVLKGPLDKKLNEILSEVNYDHFVNARFDEDICDVSVNGSDKMTQGKGFRAFLNTILSVAVQEVLNEYDLYHTYLLVLDSPIMSLKEKKYDISDSEKTSEGMRNGLFRYFVDHELNRQTIVLENDLPYVDYRDANIIRFTKIDDGESRYGLIEDYRE